MPKNNRTRRVPIIAAVVLLALALALGLVLATAPTGGPTAFVDLAPAQVVSRAKTAADREGSVHVVVHVTHGTQNETLIDDSSRTTGHQMITAGSELAEIVVVRDIAYLRGNAGALAGYFNFPGPVASKLAGHWVSFRPSDIGYSQVTVGVTLDSTLKALDPGGTLHTHTPTRMNGVRTIGVSGDSASVRGTLYVETAGSHLPVEGVQVSGSARSGTTASIQLSRWGERIAISAPPGAIPISSFTTSAPPTTKP